MRTLNLGIAAAGLLALSLAGPAQAAHDGGHGGGHGGGFHGGVGRFGGFRGGGFAHRGGHFGGWWWGGAAGLAAIPYLYDYYDYPDYGAGAEYSPPYAGQYWYYCPNPAGYYPYVPQCSTAWVTVPAG
jgi:hypothetical protein